MVESVFVSIITALILVDVKTLIILFLFCELNRLMLFDQKTLLDTFFRISESVERPR